MSLTRCIVGGLLASAILFASPVRAADDAIGEEARKHFSAGVNLLQDPDGARIEDAYREFEAAYAASPSPKILGNLGYCALKLERDAEAISAYTRYLQEVKDIEPADAAQINRDLTTLRAGVARVTVTVDSPDATVTDRRLPVRGDSITNLYGTINGSVELGLRPGHHVIDVKVAGVEMVPWEFDAKPGATMSHAFVHKQAVDTPRASSPKVLPWVVMGVGAASLIGSGIAGAVTLGKVNAIAANCPANKCPATYALKPAQDDAHRMVTVTDTLLIGGGVVAAAGVWLFFATGSPSATRAPAAARATLTPPLFSCSPSGCYAAMNGAF